MRLLLDTHTLLWFALTDPQLSGTATSLIMDAEARLTELKTKPKKKPLAKKRT